MIPYAEVIGDPIAQSKSPVIHGFWIEALGLDADYRRAHVTPEALAGYLAERRSDPDWRGCNVTMPHKTAVLPLVDELDETARAVGAVNTIVRRGDTLLGYNTDVVGIGEPLDRPENRIGGYPRHVATYAQIIGTGGAARAAGVAMARRGEIEFFSRDMSRAMELADTFGLPEAFGHGLDQLGPARNPDDGADEQRYSHIVLNASPMGMEGKPPVPIDLSPYYPDTIVFDMVYAPLETSLLAQARARGLRTIGGLDMLIGQAAAAFTHFFDAEPPRERDPELRERLLA
ncbi:shikimate dehydrogenase family protein [Sphingomonas aracearum]|uniref:Shikimate dehydrogenase (NADP(+)) n=1 Tax=Sphingomonas aracearum TaxID=2283317 RepID=A0A369VQB3_9SPHN|nr:shikimate dehydrogenase [Sphingomonas aracearum]RDE04584.1 shikimate dehydrogenase [Sphingomonas aracearum]